MKRELITIEEAKERGLVYTGICAAVTLNAANKKSTISKAAAEEKKTNIPCYPVISEGYAGNSLTVYADPIYSKLSSYYKATNFADMFKKEFMSYEEKAHEALNGYKANDDEARKLKMELIQKGVKF